MTATTKRFALAYKAARAAPSAAEIQAKVAAAQAELNQITAEHRETALAVVSGDPDAAETAHALGARLGTMRQEIELLEAAHEAAVAKETAEQREQRAEVEAHRRKVAARFLDKRAEYAAEFQEHLAGVVRAFHKLNEYNTRVLALYPFEGLEGAVLHTGELQKLVAFEMYRQGGKDGTGIIPSMPGALAPELGMTPDRTPPLTAAIGQANATAVALIEQGRVNPTTAAIENGEDE